MFDNYIVKGIGGFYYVKTGGSLVECKPKGIFRKKRITPVAGDIVRLETDGGAIRVDRSMRASLPGVFAAGDVTGGPLQIAKAVGEGNVAAIAAAEYIAKLG